MVRYAQRVLKIAEQSPFGPKSPVEFFGEQSPFGPKSSVKFVRIFKKNIWTGLIYRPLVIILTIFTKKVF